MADNILNYTQMIADTFEPKMKNRYYMEMTSVGIPAYMVKAANRPEIQFETVKIDHINVYRKLKGKGEWQDLQITLYDPVVPSAAQLVMEWVRLSHESITGRDGYADFYKKDIDIFMLGPVGDKVEQWKLIGAFPTQVNFGDLDASSNEVATATMTLTYDYAILEF
jgi:phage tail-like protein